MRKFLAVCLALCLSSGVVAFARIISNGNSSVTVQRANDAVIDTLLVSGSSRFILGYFEGDLARFPSRALSRLFLTDPAFTQFGTAFQMIFQIPFVMQGISESVLRLQGYHKQRLIFEYPVGTILLRYDAALVEGGPTVRSFWSQVVITYGGFILSNELLVVPMTVGIMTGGAKLSLRGNTIGGASVGFSSLFGVGTDLSTP